MNIGILVRKKLDERQSSLSYLEAVILISFLHILPDVIYTHINVHGHHLLKITRGCLFYILYTQFSFYYLLTLHHRDVS